MDQPTFADEAFERYRKRTRWEQFLAEMEQIISGRELCSVIKPFYPKLKGAGRPPVLLKRMLRIHFPRHWANLSEPVVKEVLYDSPAMRQFIGIHLEREPAPDETIVRKFRHLLKVHNLGGQLFVTTGEYLQEHGLNLGTSTNVGARNSTKRRGKAGGTRKCT